MKEIKAFVQSEFLETIIDEVEKSGAKDITVTRVDAVGNLADIEKDRSHIFRKYHEKYSSMMKLEIVCIDSKLDDYINIIKKNCRGGKDFEGRIFIYDVIRAINTKTGKEGDEAL